MEESIKSKVSPLSPSLPPLSAVQELGIESLDTLLAHLCWVTNTLAILYSVFIVISLI